MPYAWSEPPAFALAALRQRRPDGDISQILPIGDQSLKSLLRAHIDGGITKFVLRSSLSDDWRTDLARLADLVLPLQT